MLTRNIYISVAVPWLILLLTPISLLSWNCQALKNEIKKLVNNLFYAKSRQPNASENQVSYCCRLKLLLIF